MYRQRLVALGILAALVSSAFISSPALGKGRGCPKYKPAAPITDSPKAAEAPKLPVVKVTDNATEEDPLVIEFEQDVSVWWYAHLAGRGPIVDGNSYHNIQVDTKKKYTGLHVRLEWPLLPEELDLYMFDGSGSMVAWSEGFNQLPEEANHELGTGGGPGFEYIPGYATARCSGYTLEVNAMWASPQTAAIKLWLGPVEWEY